MEQFRDYIECLKEDPDLSLKKYCREHDIFYSSLLGFTSRRGYSCRLMQMQARRGLPVTGRRSQPQNPQVQLGEQSGSFIQFLGRPDMSESVLQQVGITFPDGVSLSLQECSIMTLFELLDLYVTRISIKNASCSD